MRITNVNKLAAACAAALAGSAAQALVLSDYGNGSTVTQVYASGATATDNVLEFLSRSNTGGYCLAGSIHIYTAANQRVVFCNTNSTKVAGITGTVKLAFFKESEGGSSRGVTELIDYAKLGTHGLRWMDMATYASATSNCTTKSLVTGDTAVTGLTDVTGRFTCSNTFVTAPAPNIGISDTEPALSSPKPPAIDVTTYLTVNPGVHISFGVPVTRNLYTALQEASGLTPGDSPANVPSLTSAQVRGLYSGAIGTWDAITDINGDPITTSDLVTTPAATGVTAVYLCRRVATSGSQATAEAFWLSQRCVSGGRTFREPDDGSELDPAGTTPGLATGGFTNAGDGSGNVRTCLNNYHADNAWAIGVLSNEVSGSNLGNFRMVAIDGANPTLANTANGLYDYYAESVTTKIKSGNGVLPSDTAAPTDWRDEVVDHVIANIGDADTLAGINAGFAGRPWGNGGSMAIPVSPASADPAPVSDSDMVSNPVNLSRKFGNNCIDPVATQETALF